MRLIRFYCDTLQTGTVELDRPQSAHLARVLRLKQGAGVELFDGKGNIAQAVIVEVKRKTTLLEVENIRTSPPRTTGRIMIAAAIAKAQRFDWMIKKCTELGADHIAAVIFDRTVKQAKGDYAMERYRKMAIDSVRQCGRLFLPRLTGPQPLKDTIDRLTSDYPDAKLIFGGLSQSARPITDLPNPHSDIIAFIGPEGGFTEQEQHLLTANNAREIRLTDTILRIETAATALTATLCIQRDQAAK